MAIFLLYYTIATLILAFVDRVRIRFATAQKRANIRKWVSTSLAIAGAAVCVALADFPRLMPILYGAAGVRYLLFDPMLNLMRGLAINYTSKTTNSLIDKKEKDWNIPFWLERLIGVLLILASLVS